MTLTAEALRAAAYASVARGDFNADDDPLRVAVPGQGAELASDELIGLAETIMGRTVPLWEFAPGKFARLNVARVRSVLRRWAHHGSPAAREVRAS
jgi:hypothetical protein